MNFKERSEMDIWRLPIPEKISIFNLYKLGGDDLKNPFHSDDEFDMFKHCVVRKLF
jgi:hypothetical protein